MQLKANPQLYLPEFAAFVYVDLFFECTAPFFNLYFLYLLRRPFFHLNLRVLLGQFAVGLILMSLARIVLITDSIWSYLSDEQVHAVNLLANLFIYGMMDISVLLSLERIIATVLTSKYENLNAVWLTLIVVVLVWAGNFFITSYVYVLLRTEPKHRPGMVSGAVENDISLVICTVVMLLNVAGVLAFLFIRRFNLNRWRTALARKLSFRYQVMENIRTAKQLLIVMCAAFTLSSFLYFVIVYVVFTENSTGYQARVLMKYEGILTAIFANLLPCLFIKTHPKMWARAKRPFTRRNIRIAYSIDMRSKSAVDAEANIYFDLLEKSWGVVRVQK